jgi:transposase
LISRTKGGMNTKLHAVTDAIGRPMSFFMTAGQVSDYTGAAAFLNSLLKAQWLLGDRGYDADWFRDALPEKGIIPCIPAESSAKSPSNTTNADTKAATVSRSYSATLKTGGASQHTTIAAQTYSSQSSLSQLLSYSGYES